MMKRVALWGILSILLLALACTENVTNYYNNLESNGRVIGYIHGVVTDANSNARLNNIWVHWIISGKYDSTQTNELGYYAITKLPPGYYELTFSGQENYAVSRTTVTIPDLEDLAVNDIPSDEDFDFSVTADMDLYSLNASVTGRVYAIQHDEQAHLAGRVTVRADFSELDISPDEIFEATTNTSGVFSFTNLPAALPSDLVYFYTLPFSDTSGTYAVQWTSTNGLIYNGTKEIDPIFLEIGGAEPFIIRNNFEMGSFGINENIIITFSKIMVPATFTIRLTAGEESENIGYQAAWTTGIVLTINPYLTLQANETYRLEIEGYSQDNHPFQGVYDINTQEGIRFVYSNIQQVEGQLLRTFPVTSNIELNFSMPVNLTNQLGHIRLYEGSDSLLVSTVVTTSTDGKTVIINPDNSLEPGLGYAVDYQVFSTIEGDFEEGWIEFKAVSGEGVPAQVTGFTTTTGQRNFNTSLLGFRWNSLAGVDEYYIFALDNGTNTDRVLVGGPYSPQDYQTTVSGNVTLPPQFDVFKNDTIQTPFANNVQITFFVIGKNEVGWGPFSAGVALKDNVTPRVTGFTQTGNANNIRNTATRTIRIHFDASEYLNTTTTPSLQIVEQGTSTTAPDDPEYVIPVENVTFAWDNNHMGGTYTITVPANRDGAGDSFVIGNLVDTNGNISTTTFSWEIGSPLITGFATTTTQRNFNTTVLDFTWNSYAGVNNYYIYARDNGANTNWTRVGGPYASTATTGQVTLPAGFDARSNDAIQTPFADGIDITFWVVGEAAGLEAFSSWLTLSDNVAPTVTLFTQSGGTADNSASSASKAILIHFDASEYLTAAPNPTFNIVENGGDPAYRIPLTAVTFGWDSNRLGGTFTVTIPANQNGAGDNFTVSTFNDSSNIPSTVTATYAIQ